MTGRLYEAVTTLRYRQIDALLDTGVDINGRTDDGRTPLMAALCIPDPDKRNHMFRFLVHRGAEMLDTDYDDVSVFQHVCRLGFLDLIQLILKRAGVSAANLLGRDKFGRTALYHAVISENVEIVDTILDLLSSRQQSVDIPDNNGLTPLLYARRMGLTEIADILQERGKANPRICDYEMHMNADAWAAEAERRQREELAQAKKQARERYLIFPPIDHATKRKEKHSKLKSQYTSLPNLSRTKTNQSTTKSPLNSSLPNGSESRLPNLHRSSDSTVNDSNLRTKSIDSALTLLGLASQAADDKTYAVSFIGSQTNAPAPSTHSTNSDSGDRPLRSDKAWTAMMNAYSIQNTANFRRTAKPPPLPQTPVDKRSKNKLSTLAIILRAGRGMDGKHKGRHGRGGKLKSLSESPGTDDNQPSKPHRRRTSSSSSNGSDKTDNKSKMGHLPEVPENDSDWPDETKTKEKRRSTNKRDVLPNITVS